ncbi:MAG: DNA-processing protein DprA [Fusobacterium sp.]|uniref:DNA-processing protein DprA n=1 Tax=Fusobacterium sp. TaxID=68766 RepID=UPI0026DC0223|nr:DNA-processing protein DprA [Fusobacterium sp.]MDO4690203.1 DNA-processing protein DprA [Fusobacterium sp.]
MKNDFFTIDDDIYPESLKNICEPPKKIYYKGNIDLLKNERMISVVGTRRNSSYGKLCCEILVKKLIKADVVLVSGFAMGIDSICHRTCIENNGKTIAVVAAGLDVIYPATNINLWKKIEENGLILSEYEYGTKPFRVNFPKRNRIIAGLSRATVVIESKEKGGSLITANMALEEGRDIFAIPGDIFSENAKGCNSLIRDSKAKLLISADEILEEYAWLTEYKLNVFEEDFEKFSKIQKNILNFLSSEKTLDCLVQELNLDLSTILTEIMDLEIKGVIKGLAGGKYIKLL